MHPKQVLLALLTLTSFGFAADDSCDDYVSRHYKKDLVPVSAKVTEMPRSGDLAGYQALEVTVKNIGSETIDDQRIPGSIISGVRPITISLEERIGGRPRVTSYQGWLRAPLRSGQQTTVMVSLPSGKIKHCSTISLHIDSRHTAGQYGCGVFGNDRASYKIRLAKQPRICADDIFKPGPIKPVKP